MVGKSQIKLIKSLQLKKNRNLHQLFVVEGLKTIQELLKSSFEVYSVFSTDDHFVEENSAFSALISSVDLKKMSSLNTPNGYLGVFKMSQKKAIHDNAWVVAVDTIQDPGNLGTIIRLCDWFGIKDLVCSSDTVDCYNPKVIQATMGSITRVNVTYLNLIDFLEETGLPIYGAFMDGETVYTSQMPVKGILVMGNEANGVSAEVEKLVQKRIAIPQFGAQTAESLNVATATAILLNEIRRG
ncbi:tRNA/rRNA methyltransferase (SpoU) [Cellulophaga algicola DSM 14237]|uniref:tRNA/rRNA methyltransferase (SpoU) n=1 Tax=Cellulophaga algicola (strain DSM 14237 / IC166 / ACAM 630) TaxID=688270 RepID=E6X5Z7_CELAD|nr:RNA methyltransferase [Cellulophaga algicola]ADV49539.1 tRNA/rRNA methyltransferase (SpoU) [Cellulophaga algicola DSM 14237]